MFETEMSAFSRRALVVCLTLFLCALCSLSFSIGNAYADETSSDGDAMRLANADDQQVTADDVVIGGESPENAIELNDLNSEAQLVADEVVETAQEESPVSADLAAEDEEAVHELGQVESADEPKSAEKIVEQLPVEQETPLEAKPAKEAQIVAIQSNSSVTTQAAATIADGSYAIKTAAAYGQALGNKSSYSANAAVQSYAFCGSYDQLFFFQHEGNGLYSVFSIHSGLALTISGGKVVQASYTGANSQLFEVRSVGAYYALISQSGAITAASNSEAKAQSYSGTASQRFKLAEGPLVIPGVQVLRAAASTGKAVRAQGGSASPGANAQVAGYSNDGSYNLAVQRSGKGYAVRPTTSGNYLAPLGSVVKQNSGSYAWDVQFSSKGARRGLMLVNGDMAAQVSGGSVAVVKKAPSAAQSFLPSKSTLVSSGYYNVQALSGKMLDVYNGSFSSGANIQVFDGNGTGAQVFYFEDIGGGVFLIRSSKSYKVLEAKSGGTGESTNIWQYEQNRTPAQLWVPVVDAGGRLAFVNVKSGKALTVSGSNVRINTSKGSADQHWRLIPTKQYSLTGNSELDRIVANVLGTHTTLWSAFKYVAYGFSYREGNRHWSGWSLSDSTSRSYAIEMYNYGSGNCYRFASLFAWLARGLGYSNVVVRTGWVVGYSAPQAPHGWVTIDGYICDPDMQHEAPSRDWYWQTWASAPTAYYDW